jgi:hypothetical protein
MLNIFNANPTKGIHTIGGEKDLRVQCAWSYMFSLDDKEM